MENIIVHILTVGFNHKRGCEIEFIYPSIIDESLKLKQLEIWKDLPSLALPDGIHKNNSELINFIIPGCVNSCKKVLFGISCFKQVPTKSVKTTSVEVTRNTIQKCVVVLASLPLFGAIGSLLCGITDNYFEIGDFEKRDVLIESFGQLNEHFRLILDDNERKFGNNLNIANQELSIINLICRYEYDILTLIKMMLLRRKTVFFIESVNMLTSTILSLVSLFQGVLETTSFQNSLDNLYDTSLINSLVPYDLPQTNSHAEEMDDSGLLCDNKCYAIVLKATNDILFSEKSVCDDSISESIVEYRFYPNNAYDSIENDKNIKISDCEASSEDFGFPIHLYDQNHVILPCGNIEMLDILDNVKIKSFIIGTNNQLWKMKFAKFDILVNEDIKNGGIEFNSTKIPNKVDDCNLSKLLQLTAADRKFAKYLIHVVKDHLRITISSDIRKSNSVSGLIGSNLTVDVGDDVTSNEVQMRNSNQRLSDPCDLECWLRQVLLGYIKAILLNAAALGSRTSFEDFGLNFLLAVQQQSFFKQWYNTIDKTVIVSNIELINKKLSTDSVKPSSHTTGDYSESRNAGKPHSIMNYDHPGRLILPKGGDNIPGFYQFKDFTDQRKALINKSVDEVKRFSSNIGEQLKLTRKDSKSKSKPKMRCGKLGDTLWYNVDNY